MKIAILSTAYPLRGGIAQFNALIYREFEKKNDVKVFTFKRQYPNFLFPGETQYVTDDDVADPIPSVEILDTINPFSYWKTAREVKEYAPDILITKYWMTFFAPSLGTVLKRNKNAKRISILDNVIPHEKRFFDTPANKFFLKHNDGFVVMSDVVLKDLLSIKPDAKYLRIDHPVYNQFGALLPKAAALKELGLPEGKKYLLFFGFIREYKGLDLLIEALNKLDDAYHAIVAGEVYGSFDKYQTLIDTHGLGDRVHTFTQYISDEEVKTYFSAADVCMLPYKSATQSGITAIAHHFEMPIIATDVGGLKESIEHGVSGLIVDKAESEGIAKAVESFFGEHNPDDMREAIRKHNEENTWENFSAQIIEFAETL
ncbi:MAG: glycosyltransferase family 4 protein [Crocinitomicaceae bacterium]